MNSSALVHALIDGVLTGSVYALMATGLTLIFGVMEIINVAQGILVILGAYFSYTLSTHFGIDLFLGLLILNRLPRLHHPLFEVLTGEGYFLLIDAPDNAARRLVEDLRPLSIAEVAP